MKKGRSATEPRAEVLDARVIAKRLRAAREARGLGVREAAREAGINAAVISLAEKGDRIEGMTIVTMRKLAQAYGQTEAWLSGVEAGSLRKDPYPARAQAMRTILNRMHEAVAEVCEIHRKEAEAFTATDWTDEFEEAMRATIRYGSVMAWRKATSEVAADPGEVPFTENKQKVTRIWKKKHE